VVRQLQHEEGLVPQHLADCHCRLESAQGQRVDGAFRRRVGKNYENWIPAGERHRTGLRKRCPSAGNFVVGPALTVCVVVSQADQGARESLIGTKTQTDESGATAKAVNTFIDVCSSPSSVYGDSWQKELGRNGFRSAILGQGLYKFLFADQPGPTCGHKRVHED
jgi:hypothetical protein